MSYLQIPDAIFNWIENFFNGREHCTRFCDILSPTANISASVVQGSSLGPASYVVTASDMRPGHTDIVIIKYADDTCLVVPATNSHTCAEELLQILGGGRQQLATEHGQIQGNYFPSTKRAWEVATVTATKSGH